MRRSFFEELQYWLWLIYAMLMLMILVSGVFTFRQVALIGCVCILGWIFSKCLLKSLHGYCRDVTHAELDQLERELESANNRTGQYAGVFVDQKSFSVAVKRASNVWLRLKQRVKQLERSESSKFPPSPGADWSELRSFLKLLTAQLDEAADSARHGGSDRVPELLSRSWQCEFFIGDDRTAETHTDTTSTSMPASAAANAPAKPVIPLTPPGQQVVFLDSARKIASETGRLRSYEMPTAPASVKKL